MIILGIIVYLILGIISAGLIGNEVEKVARDRVLSNYEELTTEIRKSADQAAEVVGNEFVDYFVDMIQNDKPLVVATCGKYLLLWPIYAPLMLYRVHKDYDLMIDVVENKM